MITRLQKVLLYTLAIGGGGIAGYLISEVILDRLEYGVPPVEGGRKEVTFLDLDEESQNNSEVDVKPFKEFIREYRPNPLSDTDIPAGDSGPMRKSPESWFFSDKPKKNVTRRVKKPRVHELCEEVFDDDGKKTP